jgi:hypothetical protein
MERARGFSLLMLGGLVAVLLAACGSTEQLPEAVSTSPLTNGTPAVNQTGSPDATIDQSSVTYKIDNAGILVVKLKLTSAAAEPQTIAVRGSLFNASGLIIGDVTGGAVKVDPSSTQDLQLTGNAPSGIIASVTFEVTTQASPTPTATPTAA